MPEQLQIVSSFLLANDSVPYNQSYQGEIAVCHFN